MRHGIRNLGREETRRSAWVGMLVQPQTVLGWHRELVRRKWAASVVAEVQGDQVSIPNCRA
jgi:hypothetical protein